jgi:hypothetical protein
MNICVTYFVCCRVLLQGLDEEFMRECMNKSMKAEILGLMQEDVQIRAERERLRNKLERLTRAQEMLTSAQISSS